MVLRYLLIRNDTKRQLKPGLFRVFVENFFDENSFDAFLNLLSVAFCRTCHSVLVFSNSLPKVRTGGNILKTSLYAFFG